MGNFHFFFSISLTIGASRLMEALMDLPRLLFGVGFQIFFFIVTPQIFTFSLARNQRQFTLVDLMKKSINVKSLEHQV